MSADYDLVLRPNDDLVDDGAGEPVLDAVSPGTAAIVANEATLGSNPHEPLLILRNGSDRECRQANVFPKSLENEPGTIRDREFLAAGNASQGENGREYGSSYSQSSTLCRGKDWGLPATWRMSILCRSVAAKRSALRFFPDYFSTQQFL